jgi:Zn-dependent protease
MNLSFPLFRLFGIPIRIHWFYPLVLILILTRGLIGSQGSGLVLGYNALMAAGLLITTIIHELGHCFGARSVGTHADQIVIWPLGGLAYVGHGGAPRHDIKIAVLGPITHLPLAAATIGLLLLQVPWNWTYLNPLDEWIPFSLRELFWADVCVGVLRIQVLLFVLNLVVPSYPLDGGRILANLLVARFGRDRAAILTTYFSIPIGIAIFIFGFLRRDFFLGLMGIWMLFEAYQIRKLAAEGQLDAHPMFGNTPEFDYMPDRPQGKGFLASWREKRARAAVARDRERELADRARVDAVLEKVSREGIGSLTSDERRILDEASRRGRGER